jgi:hypothetical protein
MKEPGRVTSGDCISACVGCQVPALHEAQRINLMVFAVWRIRLSTSNHGGDACGRLEKMALSYTGEALPRPMFGKSSL